MPEADTQAPRFVLALPRAQALAPGARFDLLRQSHQRGPKAGAYRLELARLLIQQNRPGEAIELLEVAENDFAAWSVLGEAYLFRDGPCDYERAREVLARAVAIAPTPRSRAQALADIGKALTHLGDDEGARSAFDEALRLAPGHTDAFRRLAMLDLRQGRAGAALERCDGLIAAGARSSSVLGARYLALAALGRRAEAAEIEGLDRFLGRESVGAPARYPDIHSFNAALAEELTAHPGLRLARSGGATLARWRVDEPLLERSRAFRHLLESLAPKISLWVDALPSGDHPWLKARPRAGQLRAWSVITHGAGHEEWHMHHRSWLSGVYYVQSPPAIATGTGIEGCIQIGAPSLGAIGLAAAGEGHLARPVDGLLLLFPSHAFHRTFPTGAADRRISVAFDVMPA